MTPARRAPSNARVFALAFLFLASALLLRGAGEARVWRCGWYPWPPYQFETSQGELPLLNGLDVQLMRAIARQAGHSIVYEEVGWLRHQEDLAAGRREIAAGATWTEARAVRFLFSEPYRTEENVLYVRVGERSRHVFPDVAALLAASRAGTFRLGVLRGFAYASADLRAYIAGPDGTRRIAFADTDADNLDALVEGRIDGFVADRLVAATLANQLGYASQVAPHPLDVGSTSIHAMFSRVSATEADVADFNRALGELRANGSFDRIVRNYLMPPMLNVTVGGRWFYRLELIGTAAFALSGVLLARRHDCNLAGAFVLAVLPAAGGGLVRDLLADRHPVAVLRSPDFILLVAGLVVSGWIFFKLADRRAGRIAGRAAPEAHARRHERLDRLLAVFDSIGLALFVVIGVRVAVETRCSPLWIWGPLLAVLTAAGGGILRDIVRPDESGDTLTRGFYAEIALAWGLVFSLFLEWQVRRLQLDEMWFGTLTVIVGAFLTRMLVVWRRWENPFRFGRRHPAV